MSREVFDQMDLEHKGYITKAEFLKLNAKRAGEENALAAFNKMDVNLNGMVILLRLYKCCWVLISG